MVSPSWTGAPGARRCGQAVDRQWAESPSSLHGRPLRLSRMRRERGSVDLVSPPAPRPERTETEEQTCGSLVWISPAPSPRRSPGTTANSNDWGASTCGGPLEAFAKKLSKDDIVVVEATGNAASVAAVIAPHVKRVAIANRKQVRIIAHAKIKTDTIDASVLAQLYASGLLPEVWVPDEPTQALRRQVTRRNQIVRQRSRLKNIIQSILHSHFDIKPNAAKEAQLTLTISRAIAIRSAGGSSKPKQLTLASSPARTARGPKRVRTGAATEVRR